MRIRMTFLSVFLLFAAGAALAVPTVGQAPESGNAALTATSGGDSSIAVDAYALNAPVRAAEPSELAIYDICGCTPPSSPGPTFPCPPPRPGPWGGPTIFFPFPLPCPGPWPF